MPRQLKVSALITFVLAVSFYLFWQISKHNLALSQVNTFAEDPYDAVGSFGVQLAIFTALLSVVRAFRPYQPPEAIDGQKVLLVRSEYLSCLSVAVTLVADIIAMLRHPSIWIASPAGQLLAALVVGALLLTALVGWLIYHAARTTMLPSAQGGWTRAIVISIVCILVLALYPENWRQNLPGALFTVLVGMAILFGSAWALGMAVSPSLETRFEDFIDDLASLYRWLKAHTGRFAVVFNLFEHLLRLSFIRLILSWLNPRKHTWNCVILLGMFMGVLLALAEALGEGVTQIGRFAPVVVVFISLEVAGVLLGYVLLAKPLGLFRHVSVDNMDHKVYQGPD